MKLPKVLCVTLIYGLILQTNNVDGIFWQFLKPFWNVSVIGSDPPASQLSSSSNNTTVPNTNISTGDLNSSSLIVATNSNLSANIGYVYGSNSGDSSTTTSPSTTPSSG
ncbi:hypothetical protein PVAND_006751 [Polypedilum vanderplanki]|uniref:Uncharacterized protein n=1 Tax=Polypedilum vanderplanki TaxID=319348 RepID=A0A9J6C5T9_POLVA|nr:hypothetical protein PVAND_006751 [Polypedilum vanderplanki]